TSEYIRAKLLEDTKDIYLNFLRGKVADLTIGREITYKNLIKDIWNDLTKIERKGLLMQLEKEIQNKEFNLELIHRDDKIKKYIFKRIESASNEGLDCEVVSIENIEIFLDEYLPDYMEGVIRIESGKIYLSDGSEKDIEDKFIDKEFHQERELVQCISKEYEVSKDVVEVLY
ncbi:MAG: hypothetical protein ACRCXT_10480, partial [Paraclostridium sp.]